MAIGLYRFKLQQGDHIAGFCSTSVQVSFINPEMLHHIHQSEILLAVFSVIFLRVIVNVYQAHHLSK